MSAIDFGRPTRIIRLFDGRLTFRLDMKVTGLVGLMAALALVVTLLTLASGEYQVPLGDVVAALFRPG